MHGAAGGLPLIAYTMPAMAGSQWPLDVLRELAAEGVVSGVKESADDIGRMLGIIDACPQPFAAFCGTPTLLISTVLAGGHGGILAIANAVPERCVAVYEAVDAGDGLRAAELFAPLVPLIGRDSQRPEPLRRACAPPRRSASASAPRRDARSRPVAGRLGHPRRARRRRDVVGRSSR